MLKNYVIYHIGLPKTGTTSIQHWLKQNQSGRYIFIEKYSNYFFEIFNFIRQNRYPQFSASFAEKNVHRSIIYSCEEIALTWMRMNGEKNYADFQPKSVQEVVSLLYEFHQICYGDTHKPIIIIGKRDIKKLLPSWYAQFRSIHMPQNRKKFSDLIDFAKTHRLLFDAELVANEVQKKFERIVIYEIEKLFTIDCNFMKLLKDVGINTETNVSFFLNRRNITGSYKLRFTYFGAPRWIFALVPKQIRRKLRGFRFTRNLQDFLSSNWQPSKNDLDKLDKYF